MAEVGIGVGPFVVTFGGSDSNSHVDNWFRFINGQLANTEGRLNDSVYNAATGVQSTVQRLSDNILGQVITSALGIQGSVGSVESNLKDYIEAAARAVDRSSYNRDQQLEQRLSGAETAVKVGLDNVLRSVLSREDDNARAIGNALMGIDLKIDSTFGKAEGVLREIYDFMSRKIEYVIENTITLDSGIFETILEKVRDILADKGLETREIIHVFDGLINGTFAEAQAKLLVPEEKQADETKRIADTLDKIEKTQKAATEKGWLGPDGVYILERMGAHAQDLFEGDNVAVQELWNKIVEIAAGVGKNNPLDDDCLLPLLRQGSGTGIGGWIANVITLAMAAGILPFQMATVQANRKLQNFRTCFPDVVLSPAEMRGMYHILGYKRSELVELFQRQGYSRDDANIVMQTWETPPDITLLFSMFFRQEIGKDELRFELRKHGYNANMADSIIKISTYLPPVQDLITMSVRDVFDEATVARNRQNEDFPPDFLKWMRQQGVADDWSKKYWAAHWRLPSETMGFEMFHRGIIDENELKSLMKSLDIMPGWRDRLIKLSYNPLTRVDVRRMYSVGVLKEAEVTKAYLDIGYSPDNAKRLTDFTVKLSEEEGLLTANVASDLTRTNIIGFYTDHIIKREVALGLLLQEGTNAIAAELLLKSADFDIERKERKQLADLIKTRFQTGRYSYEQAILETQRLGFSDREKEAIILDIELIQAKEHKLPSRADLDKFRKKGVIDDATYLTTMAQLGYSQYWAERYLEAI